MKDETSKVAEKTEDKKTPSPIVAQNVTTHSRGRRRGKLVAATLLILFLSFTAGLTGAWIMGQSNTTTTPLRSGVDGNSIVTAEEEGIAGVASKVSPSVVSILTKSERQSYYGSSQTQQGAGTGIIVSSDGYVLTNKHVVEGSDTVSIVTSDGSSYDNVRVIGTDPLNDVAFLKINGANNLKVAELGDSSSLRIGQSVVAIGNALGQYQNTVTSGIVSGTGRSVTAATENSNSSETLTDLVQTDAAINPGNSGGPLVNLSGQVIGINTAIASDANGLGFSIPINAVKGLLKGVLANGKVERAYVGVNYVSITPDVAQEFKLPYVDHSWEVSMDTHAEPEMALYAADDGLALIKLLIIQASQLLRSGGSMYLEADPRQHAAMIAYAKEHSLQQNETNGFIVSFYKVTQ